MPDGEVKIHITADGDSKKIEDMQKQILNLRRAAEAYDKNNKVDMSGAAKSARSEANALEREVLRMSKNRAAEEKLVTREMKEQTAERKAGIGTRGMSRGMSRLANFAGQNMPGGGQESSMLLQAGMRSGNPLVMGATIVAAIGLGLAKAFTDQKDADKLRGLEYNSRRADSDYRLKRESGVFGSSSSLVATGLAADEEIAHREGQRDALKEKARVKWNAPSTWGSLIGLKNSGQIEVEENEKEIEAKKREKDRALKRAAALFEQTEGGLELDSLRNRAKRSQAGNRAAFVDEEAGKAMAKYREVIKSAGDTEKGRAMAKEMATLTYQNDLRDRQANAGAGLVDSHSGGAGIAAAARWAMQGTPQGSEIGSKLETLIGVVNRGNQDAQTVKHSK
ncbi:MAG: hypothetical protein WCO94_12630 [Verrucomicrobiota bacterium]